MPRLAAFLVIFAVLQINSLTRTSATWDEPVHLTAGYTALTRGDHRVDPEHPPLLRMWAALPLLSMSNVSLDTTRIDRANSTAWAVSELFPFAHDFMYQQNDADRLLYAARAMNLTWGVLLGILVFAWTYEWLGLWPATLALGLYTLEPNIAAHASLVTTDLGEACFAFGAIYFLWRTVRHASPRNLAGLTLFTVLSTVSKYSGLIVAPILLVLLSVMFFWSPSIRRGTVAGIGALLVVASIAGVWSIYGLYFEPSATRGWTFRLQDARLPGGGTVRERLPLVTDIVTWVDDRRLLPNVFTQGFLYGHAKAQRRDAFLNGETSAGGWWYYFPAAIAYKTPLSLLVLVGAGLFALAWRPPPGDRFTILCIIVSTAGWSGVLLTSSLNLGLRHALPLYPFFFMIAAASARLLASVSNTTRRITFASVLLVGSGELATAYPSTLTFFNQLAGGPSRGAERLSDSNIDWGQDLKGLARWMTTAQVESINLAYFGTADPTYYRMTVTHLPGSQYSMGPASPTVPGYVAISASILNGSVLPEEWRPLYSAFRAQTPVTTIGNSIHVYRVEERWPTPLDVATAQQHQPDAAALTAAATLAGVMVRVGWLAQATDLYTQVLRYQPGNVDLMGDLAVTELLRGRTSAALDVLRRAVGTAPSNGALRRNLAQLLLDTGEGRGAAEQAQVAVQLRPDDATAHDILGQALALIGQLEPARAAFQRALALDPGNADAAGHLASLQSRRRP